MTGPERTLLSALRAGLLGQKLSEDPELGPEDWERTLQLARMHETLPLVFEAVSGLPSFSALDRDRRKRWRDDALGVFIRQTLRSNDCLTLLLHLQRAGLDPIVVKGMVCRSLYPVPSLRPSADEDFWILPEESEAYHQAILAEGFVADEPDTDPVRAWESAYHRVDSPAAIELHKALFPPDSDACGDLNGLFESARERSVRLQIEDVSVRTLAPTDHVLYLLCHALKHFLYSGVGIRQAADLAQYSRRFEAAIDWQAVWDACRSRRMETFAAALLQIGQRFLVLEKVPEPFASIPVETYPLLEDMLSGGLYGVNDLDRAHSSSITLDAVAAQRSGRKNRGALASVFPAASSLEGRYPYLRRKPWLLPAAWVQRAWGYVFRGGSTQSVSPSKSLRIAQERIQLLKKYQIIS